MERYRFRMRTAVLVALLLTGLASCSTDLDATASEEGRGDAPPARSDPSPLTFAALRELQTSPPPQRSIAAWMAEKGSEPIDLGAALKREKVRNGIPINYHAVVGNGVVSINDWRGDCTAQVINRWFLLTAAHCVLPDVGDYLVRFTNRTGNRVTVYRGVGVALLYPDWSYGSRDLALIYLASGMETCQDTTSACAGTQPDRPQNAGFQYHRPGYVPFTDLDYVLAGYGSVDAAGSMAGVLRTGAVNFAGAAFTEDGFQQVITWAGHSQARPCEGDSGSPLVFAFEGMLLHNGVASYLAYNCNDEQGAVWFSGLSQEQATWVLNVVQFVRDYAGLPYACVAATDDPTGFSLIQCDNDGTLY